MSSKTLFSMILCLILFSVGLSYYYYYKSNFGADVAPVHTGGVGDGALVANVERDVIAAIKNDIGDKNGGDATIRTQIEHVVEDVIRDHPEVIVKSVTKYYQDQQVMQRKQAEQKVAESRKELEDPGMNPVYGATNPRIKVVEFFDYACGYCKRMLDVNKRIAAKYPDVQFVFREYPLYPASREASRAALAVNIIDHTKYLAFQERMFNIVGERNKENIEKAVEGLGIDLALFRKTLDDKKDAIEKVWEVNGKLIGKVGVSGTPTLIVGGKLIPGFVDFGELEKIITSSNVGSKSGVAAGKSDVRDKSSSSPTVTSTASGSAAASGTENSGATHDSASNTASGAKAGSTESDVNSGTGNKVSAKMDSAGTGVKNTVVVGSSTAKVSKVENGDNATNGGGTSKRNVEYGAQNGAQKVADAKAAGTKSGEGAQVASNN